MTNRNALQSWESLLFSQVEELDARGIILAQWQLSWDTFAEQIEEIYESMPPLKEKNHDVNEISPDCRV